VCIFATANKSSGRKSYITNYRSIYILVFLIMGENFVIGNRLKDEWIAVLDTTKKILEFTSNLVKAQEYQLEEDAQMDLAEIQKTGYFSDLQIYIKKGNKAYRIDETD
jgi:hypothetical protein